VAQTTLRFQLAQALGQEAGEAHYRAALAEVEQLPETATSAPAWAALGAWGVALGRQDRTQEGYAEALRLLSAAGDWPRWREVAERYRAAAQALGNRRLVQILSAELAEHTAPAAPPSPPPDPVVALLDAERWEDALAALEPRARTGDEAATLLLVAMIEGAEAVQRRLALLPASSPLSRVSPLLSPVPSSLVPCPLSVRLDAAALLGDMGDPRLLNVQTGDAPLGGYWCDIDAGPFWYGDERHAALREMTLPYSYRIARYPVTNAEYRRFIEAGGYQERRWWTENGWRYTGFLTQPFYWENATYNQPTQPVVGVTWWECAAYCAWLTEAGRAAGWLPATDEIRLPTSLEWERAARGTDQRRYPWGDAPPDPERANYDATGVGQPTPVGCFPAGAAACGTLDMAGNVMEWMSTPVEQRDQMAARKDFTPNERVLLSWSMFRNNSAQLSCGARGRYDPIYWNDIRSFRIIRSRALAE
jgi:formylglycine-generating enzyme required for sulfatase activity